jgi:hypothetical protein
MLSYTITIGVILFIVFIYVYKHIWYIEYTNDKSGRSVKVFKRYDLPLWGLLLALLGVFIPFIGQVILLGIDIGLGCILEDDEVFCVTNLDGLYRSDYDNKTPEYMERYNKPSFIQRIFRFLKKVFTYRI